VEHNHLSYAVCLEVTQPVGDGAQMKVANGAAGKPTKLQVRDTAAVGQRDRLVGYGGQFQPGALVTDLNAVALGFLRSSHRLDLSHAAIVATIA
jgi:hypothetical protein